MSEEGIKAGRWIRREHITHSLTGELADNCPHCNPSTHHLICDHETVIASTSFPPWEGYQCIKCHELFSE